MGSANAGLECLGGSCAGGQDGEPTAEAGKKPRLVTQQQVDGNVREYILSGAVLSGVFNAPKEQLD
jgi:hypothetical protein